MKTDNKKETYKIWLQKFITTVLFVPAIIVVWFTDLFNNPVLGLEKGHYIIIISVLYFSVFMYHFLKRPDFIFFSDNGPKIILRYYNISAMNRKKHSIEIPKDLFMKYDIEKFFMGNEKLILYQKHKTGIAKFPGVSLSALSKEKKNKIKKSLDQYLTVDKK